MATIFKLRRDTAANWSSENPTLADGELGFDKTNTYLKIGDGSTAWNSLGQFTQSEESITDFIGGTVTGNTETFITVTYDDSDNTLDFVVPVLDEDNLATNSATHLATQQSIKAYVDAQVTAQDLDFTADSGGPASIDLDSETLGIGGSTGIDTSISGNNVQIAIDGTVTTLAGTQTLTNKTLTTPTLTSAVLNTGVSGSAILDEDNMATNSATQLATQQSIKAYVDAQVDTADALSELADTTITSPADGSLLLYDTGNSVWIDNVMSGDATLADTGAVTLATVNSNVGSFGGATAIPVLTVNAKGLVTAASTASITTTLTVGADSGSNDTVALASDTLDFTGGTGIDTTVSDNDISIAIDSTVATLTGSQTLTNKTLTTPVIASLKPNGSTTLTMPTATDTLVGKATTDTLTNKTLTSPTITSATLNTGVSGSAVKDEDDMSSDSATHLATQQSIKAYVDTQVTAQDLDIAGDSGTGAIDLDSETLTIAGTANEIETSMSGNTLTVGLPNNVTIAGNLTVSGTQTTVSSTTVNVADPMLSLATNNGSADAVDIGFYGLYDTSGSQDLYSGLFRDANDSGKWKLFKDSQAEPTTTVNTSATGHATGTLVATLEGNVTGNLTGNVVGNVTGNASGTAATVTGAAQTAITSVGTLTALQVDNININGNSITTTGGTDLNIGPVAGQQIVLDGTIEIDAGVVTGATSITSTAFVGDLTGDVTGDTSGSAGTVTSIAAHIKDEDNMASNSATHVPSQQSVKAYVDGQTTDETAEGSSNLYFTNERVDDRVNALIIGGTNMTATYNDAAGTLTLDAAAAGGYDLSGNDTDDVDEGSVNLYYTNARADARITAALIDEDNMASDSATRLPSQQSVKAYVDAQVTAQDLDFAADSGGSLAIDLDSEALTFTGGTGIDTSGSGNAVTFAIDSTVATLAGSQTLTNKTLTSPVLNTGVSGSAIKDEDNMASDSATHLATQQSIKAYVDAQVTAQDLDFQGDSGGALSIDLDSETLDIAGGTGVTTSGSGNTLTVAIGQAVATNSNVEFANIVASGNLTVNGTTTTINTTNTTVTDSLVEYATGTSGTPANDSGIVIERGSADNAFIGFDESADKFTVGTGSFTGASTGNLTITTGTLVANIEAATVSATGNITVGGTVDGRDIDTDGTKLDTVETNADVTDATNVEAAGAVMESGNTASAKIPAGTTAQRDGSPSAGFFRWNTTTSSAEIYDGSAWGLVGGGNTTDEIGWEHESESSGDYVMEDGNNMISCGPIFIGTGSSVTVGSGSTWTVV